MSSLLRSLRSSLGGRDFTIKNSLVANVTTSIRDLLVEQADPDHNEESCTEAVSAFCIVLEAIFIHGLKESFIQRMSQAMISEFDARPDPNFWSPLLEVSHRDVIDEVSKLNFIQTDVGRCRAWLRLALNEGVLTRYLEAMRTQGQRTLSHYYCKGALLRDVEMLDVLQRLLEGIESFPFNFPLNSSLLNVWTNQPLLLAGIWTPPVKPPIDPIAVATDVAQALERDEQESLNEETVSIASFVSHQSTSFNPMLALSEEEALKIILGTPVNETPIAARHRSEEISEESRKLKGKTVIEPEPIIPLVNPEQDSNQDTLSAQASKETDAEHTKVNEDDDNLSAMGNSLIGRLGWSSSFEEELSDSGKNKVEEQHEKKRKEGTKKTKKALQSYHSLLESYNTASSSSVNPPDLSNFLQQFEPNNSDSPSEQTDLSYPQDLGFEIVDNSPSLNLEFGNLLLQVSKLPRELGLDAQKYTCFGCDHPIGFNFGAVKLCALSGRYFCEECTVVAGEEWVVPARVLFNWDFQKYSVSKKAAAFLSEIQHHPLFDLKTLNARLYLAVVDVAELQKLRNELNLLRAYLFTCREPIIEELQKMVWPREYLYEHVHLYSFSDLLQIPNGILAQQLKQIVSFARKHVHSCWLCSQKGFFCEVCNNPNVIYPFDTENTYRCGGCSAVFHKMCLTVKQPCPKCERQKLRSTPAPDTFIEV